MKSFYLNSPIVIEIGKPSDKGLHGFILVELKGFDGKLSYHYGNIGKSLESPYITFGKKTRQLGSKTIYIDRFRLEKPWLVKNVYIGIFDKEFAGKGAVGRFAKGSVNEFDFSLRIYNNKGSSNEIEFDCSYFDNISIVGKMDNDGYGITSNKFKTGASVSTSSIKDEDLWNVCIED